LAFELHTGIPLEGQPVPWPAEGAAAAHARLAEAGAAEGLRVTLRTDWYDSEPAPQPALWADANDGEAFRRCPRDSRCGHADPRDAAVDLDFVHEATTDGLHAPALAFGDARVMALLADLARFSHVLVGFTNRELVDLVAGLLDQPPAPHSWTHWCRTTSPGAAHWPAPGDNWTSHSTTSSSANYAPHELDLTVNITRA